MLNLINNLAPLLEDNYREFGVREYAKIVDVSPPTASKMLQKYRKEGLLLSRKDKMYILYRADRSSKKFTDFARVYWREQLGAVVDFLKDSLNSPDIILFGSLPKLEAKFDSDIDLFIDAKDADINLAKFERKLKRKIQLHFRRSFSNPQLRKNIDAGVVL